MKRFLHGNGGRFVDLYHVKIVDTLKLSDESWAVTVSCGGIQDSVIVCEFNNHDEAIIRATDIINLAGTIKNAVDL